MKKALLLLLLFVVLISTVCKAQPGYITTMAGTGSSGFSGDGGLATAALIASVKEICTDGADNVYIADYSNKRIRKISPLGIITTIAGGGTSLADGVPATSALLNLTAHSALAADKAGNIYFIEDNTIRKISFSTGIITTIAGSGAVGYSGDGGPAIAASFNFPTSLCLDSVGNLYICDGNNNCVRRVNTVGIISTIAGGVFPGFSGDGGPATAARLNDPAGICLDTSGNLYISDYLNHRIRRVSPGGVITTYAGSSGTGFGGDGGLATAAAFSLPGHVCMDVWGNLYISDFGNSRIRRVEASGIVNTVAGGGISLSDRIPATAALAMAHGIAVDGSSNLYLADDSYYRIRKVSSMTTIGISDSFTAAVNKRCNGPEIKIRTASYAAGIFVRTDFGDGFIDTTAILKASLSGGYAVINHSYAATGTYTITKVLYYGTVPVDTILLHYNYTFCRTLPVKLYNEISGNCVMDVGEAYLSMPSVAQVDSNGINIATIPATSGFNYNAYAPPGTVYSFRLISKPDHLYVACPATGIITDTVSSAVALYPDKYFGLACIAGTKFDFNVKPVASSARVNSQAGHIYAANIGCYSSPASVTLQFSPKWVFDATQAHPIATTVTGNTATWNIGLIYGTDPAPFDIYYKLLSSPATGDLRVGDTVHSTFTISPTTGDNNPADNIVFTLDTVRAGYDPNAIYVSPNGCVPKGTTNLEYTITFENTGNDTAHNIYVLDTLSDNLDPQSLRMVMASANMNFGILKDGGYTIAKFDFPNIKLLDSSYHDLCHGTLIYTIDMKKGLAADTRIYNRAGIYFDINEVVLTNTSENIIGCPPLAIVMPVEKASVSIFPNPTTDELTITTEKQYSSFTITNSIGQVMMEQPINGTQTRISVKTLSAGLYYISLRGSDGVTVQKFVKL